MNLNIPVAALALVGVILVVDGVLPQGGGGILILFGLVAILLAWIFGEASKRRPS